jgi:molybdate transport system substrate-binding protein
MKSTTPSAPRSQRVLLVFMAIAALTLVFGLTAMLRWNDKVGAAAKKKQPDVLMVYCAAGLRPPVEACAKDYEKETGVRIDLSYGGSQTLLANVEVSKTGDVYIPADESYIALAQQKNLTAETMSAGMMTAMLAVKKGNPKGLHAAADLMRADVKLSQANPDAAAIGKVVRTALQNSGHWDAIAKHTTVFKGTVNDAANDVAIGAADAAFVWNALSGQYPTLDFIPLPDFTNASAHIAAAVLNTSHQPQAAIKFARYLTARDKGLKQFEKNGFHVVAGDPWANEPEINLFAGAMLRPAIEQTITLFEQREGVRVNRVYNGCGILVAQMQTGKHPDAYFACDTSFMNQVSDLFLDSATVSGNQLVILVPKGNPNGIKALRDLAKPGLRLGVGHEKQCALGVLTRNTLMTNGTYFEVRKNVAVESPTGDFLVNQLKTKSLDAVIAYISNAAGSANELDAIAVDLPCATAAQPVALSRDSKYPQITSRLIATLKSAESKQRFEANGFKWLAK